MQTTNNIQFADIQEPLRWLAYCRKSSDERSDKQTLSIGAQLQEIKTIVSRDKLNCVNLEKPYCEERSAFSPGRPLFDEMLRRVESGEANGIILWEISRASRNPMDSGHLRYLMEQGKLKEIRTRNKIYSDLDSFLMDIEFATSNKESKDTSQRVKRNLMFKAKEKKEFPCWAPIGYLNMSRQGVIAGKSYDKIKQHLIEELVEKEKRLITRIEIDPLTGPLIKKLFENFSTGLYSLDTILALTDEWGLTNRYGKSIARTTVSRVLVNPFFYGCFKFHGEVFEGTHQPLIPKALFDKTQEVLSERTKPLTRHARLTYSGLIKCAECGCFVCGGLFKKGRYELYRCSLRKRHVNCSQRKHLSKKEIERQLGEQIKKLTINKMVYELLMEDLRSRNKEEGKIHLNGLDHWQRIERHCEERISRMLDALSEGLIDKQEFLQKKNEIITQKFEAKEKIKYHKTSVGAWQKYAENLIITTSHIYEVFEKGDDKDRKALLLAVGEHFRLKDGLVTFDLKAPYSFIEAMHESASSDLCVMRSLWHNMRTWFINEFPNIESLDSIDNSKVTAHS